MSRSKPTDRTPNPAVRWFEWNGETGTVRYYDKEQKKNIDVGSDFTFILLDQLGTVRGWHEPSKSGIYANEVRDTRQDALVVKAFKGGTLAEGLYRDIKDRVNTVGGQFVANCYIAFKHEARLAIGSIRFKGAALGAWMEFSKHCAQLYTAAIRIHGFTEGKKGRIIFRMPVLTTVPLTPTSNDEAIELDKALQAFLEGYFQRTTRDRAESEPRHVSDEEVGSEADVVTNDETYYPLPPLTDDDIPF